MSTQSRQTLINDYLTTMANMRRLLLADHQPKGGLTRAQMGVMMMIVHQNIHTVKGIAEQLGISPSAATQIVNSLVEAKVLQRTPDASDRRQVNLLLNKKGQASLQASKKAMHNRIKKILEPLSITELQQLTTIQKKMLAHVQTKVK